MHTPRRIFLFTVLGFFTVLMAGILVPYLSLRTDVAFLRIKQDYVDEKVWLAAFYVHVFTGILLLPAGFTQFVPGIFRCCRGLHRGMGLAYVVVLLGLAGPSGLIMGFRANGGISSRIAFVLLSVLWLFFTAMALRSAWKKRWERHGNWMILSYSLTLSALTLRAWKWLIVHLAAEPLPPMDVYRVVAWLGFVPNLIVALWLIRRGAARRALRQD